MRLLVVLKVSMRSGHKLFAFNNQPSDNNFHEPNVLSLSLVGTMISSSWQMKAQIHLQNPLDSTFPPNWSISLVTIILDTFMK